MEEILQMSALELSKQIRHGSVSVKEAVEACKKQIQKSESQVHAYVSMDEKILAHRIKEVEEGIKSGRYTGPLAGVPIAVKDNICTRGQKTTCSSKMLENFVPTYDAQVVKQLEDAGMVILGKTNMDEFAMGSTTETSAFGVTRNPWNPEHVPGGSSGGSCAAVAAGEAVMALGSDTGGSIRQPAAYCGVTGLKPTYGRVSRYGLIAYASSLDQIGPIGKNVKDCAALFEIIAGHDSKDSTSADVPVESYDSLVSGGLSGMRIGIPKEYLAEGKEERLYSILKKEFAQLFFIIDDFTAFLELVYKSHGTESYFPITELFFKEGKGLGIYFIAGIDTGNSASAVYTQAYKNFTNEKKGIHLGGQLNQQNLFQFQIPITKQLTRLDDNIGCFVEKETPYSVFIPWNQSQ